jgi:diguanylate cyclase (GGDEF)-like protein/PAS domain S-box-containing protein
VAFRRAVERMRDLVVAFDDIGTITYANPAAGALLGHDPGDVVGRSIAEYIHPDDLVRAAEVVTLLDGNDPSVPTSPATYRLRGADGTWLAFEINGQHPAGSDDPPSLGHVLAVGRHSGDRELTEEVLELLTAGRPTAEVLELLPRFGTWRHPDESYGLVVTEPDGTRTSFGCELPGPGWGVEDGPAGSPFDLARRTGEDVRVDVEHLPPAQRAVAEAAGVSSLWVRPVDDPLTGDPALLVACAVHFGAPSEMHRYPLDLMARALRVVLQWRQHLHALERLALHDALTGLANRSRFYAAMREAAAGVGLAVLYVDLDGFKGVNDTHGHPVGDAVLVVAAERLRSSLRPGDVVARLGGDEFAALCPGISSAEEARDLAARVLDALEGPVAVDDVQVALRCSVGVAQGPSTEADGLLRAADAALYRAKRSGRGRVELDDRELADRELADRSDGEPAETTA